MPNSTKKTIHPSTSPAPSTGWFTCPKCNVTQDRERPICVHALASKAARAVQPALRRRYSPEVLFEIQSAAGRKAVMTRWAKYRAAQKKAKAQEKDAQRSK